MTFCFLILWFALIILVIFGFTFLCMIKNRGKHKYTRHGELKEDHCDYCLKWCPKRYEEYALVQINGEEEKNKWENRKFRVQFEI